MELEPNVLTKIIAYLHGDKLGLPGPDDLKYMYIACKFFELKDLVIVLKNKFNDQELVHQMDQYVASLQPPRILNPGEVLNSIFDLPRITWNK